MSKKTNFFSSQQLEEILEKFGKKTGVAKKKNHTWIIVIISVIAVAAAAFAVYKLFFAPLDEYDDEEYYEDEDIDYDEDYSEEELEGFDD